MNVKTKLIIGSVMLGLIPVAVILFIESFIGQSSAWTLWIGGAMVLVSLGFGWTFAIHVTRPIHQFQSTIRRIGRDLSMTTRLPITSTDELSDLGKACNALLDRVQTTNEQLERASTGITALTEHVMELITPIETHIQQQAIQAITVASASEQMSSTIQVVAQNAQGAAELAKEADTEAKRGGNVVGQTTEGMSRLAVMVEESSEKVASLENRSTQVGEVTEMINDIADQTNLLALNAAIEAARAGEQGRGFAVVADEVRKLAERTTKSTKEITDMIRAMQLETRETVMVMQGGTMEAQEALKLANESGDALGTILTSVDQVSQLITQIAAAAEEQSMTTKEIGGNIEKMAVVSKENEGTFSSISQGVFDLFGYVAVMRWVNAHEVGALNTEPEASFARVVLNPGFLDHLYQSLLHSHPSVASVCANIDPEKQKNLLRSEIVAMLQYARGNKRSQHMLTQALKRHRVGGTQSNIYAYWVNSLVATLEKFDPKWSPDLEQQWRGSVARGIDFLTGQSRGEASS